MQLKDNKQSIVYLVLAAVIVIGGGVGVFLTGRSAAAVEKEAEEQVSTVQNRLRGGGKTPLPTQENVEKLKEQNQQGVESLTNLIAELESFTYSPTGSDYPSQVQIGEMEPELINRESFGKFLQSVYEIRRKKIRDIDISVPDNFYLGMEEYRDTTPVSDDAAKFLAYQLAAIESILDILTTNEVESFSLTRQKTGPELLDAAGQAPQPAAAQPNSRAAAAEPKLELAIAEEHKLQLNFKSSQQVLQDLLNYLANTQEYFFVVNSVSIRNEVNQAPTVEGVSSQLEAIRAQLQESEATSEGFEVESFGGEEATGGFGEAGFGEASPEDDFSEDFGDSLEDENAPVIAVQVLGDEKMDVSVEVSLITFKPMLPEVEESASTAQN